MALGDLVFLLLYLFLPKSLSEASSLGEMSVEDGTKELRSERWNVPLEGDGDRLEVISQLRGSISAYKGHLTRRYIEIRSLFPNAAPVSEIMIKKNSLDDLLSSYVTVVERLLQTVLVWRGWGCPRKSSYPLTVIWRGTPDSSRASR